MTVVLSCIEYQVTVADGQVIFDESRNLPGSFTRFALERPKDINDSPGIWYLVHLETSSGKIPASHIVEAVEWCSETFGRCFEPYKGALA